MSEADLWAKNPSGKLCFYFVLKVLTEIDYTAVVSAYCRTSPTYLHLLPSG